jgi:hypothetical protein
LGLVLSYPLSGNFSHRLMIRQISGHSALAPLGIESEDVEAYTERREWG